MSAGMDAELNANAVKAGAGAERGESISALAKWLKTAPGRYVTEWEQAQFDTLVADVFGYNAVQLGLPQMNTLRANRMPLTCVAAERFPERSEGAVAQADGEAGAYRHSQVVSTLEELPFAAQSLDLVVLPHVLEFAEDPHQVLREVERVLIPEGQIVISGFNPVSLWGARQALGRLFDSHYLPPQGSFLTLPRVKDWLKLLSFEINRGNYGCYRPPVGSEKWIARCRFMEKAGNRWWPICGAVYVISAIKRVRGMRLIGPVWKETRSTVPALTPAAAPSVPVELVRAAGTLHG